MIEFGVFVDVFPNDWWDILLIASVCVCVFAMSFFLIDFEAFMGYHFFGGNEFMFVRSFCLECWEIKI